MSQPQEKLMILPQYILALTQMLGAMKLVLKTVRKIFPFQSVKNHPKKSVYITI